MLRTLSLLALAALALPLYAQEKPTAPAPEIPGLKAGDDPVDFTPRNWINTPTWESFSELKGDVVLLKGWGIN